MVQTLNINDFSENSHIHEFTYRISGLYFEWEISVKLSLWIFSSKIVNTRETINFFCLFIQPTESSEFIDSIDLFPHGT